MGAVRLASLLDLHAGFDALLFDHQQRLVEGAPHEARAALSRFAAGLRAHIRAEDEVILPFYESRAEIAKGGAPEYFRAEHRRIERLTAEAEGWMRAWTGLVWPAAEVVLLIEREKLLKEVLEHHDERERGMLYPECDKVAGADAAGLLERFAQVSSAEERDRLALGDAEPPEPLACSWLEEALTPVVAGEQPGRREAGWEESLGIVTGLQRTLEAGPSADIRAALLGHARERIAALTPLNAFPPRLAALAHGGLVLLDACQRAAAVRARLAAGPIPGSAPA